MKQKIPLELIEKHIRDSGWNPENDKLSNINDVINNFILTNDPDIFTESLDLGQALKFAYKETEHSGHILTLPELISYRNDIYKGKKLIDNKTIDTLTELNFGVDNTGKFENDFEQIMLVVHGGGLITPNKLLNRTPLESESSCSIYEPQEFDNILNGILPDGNKIKVFSYNEFINVKNKLPRQYGVVVNSTDYFKSLEESNNHNITAITNALVGGKGQLKEYSKINKDDPYIFDSNNVEISKSDDLSNGTPHGNLIGITNFNSIYKPESDEIGLFRYVKPNR